MPSPRVEVVHVGSAARDIAPDDPRGWRMGGGVMYAALTTARLGLRTAAVVGLDAEAATGHELTALRDAGVDILPVLLPEGPVFHNVETPTGRQQTAIAAGVPVRPVALPASWRDSAAWSLVPVADEVPDDWAEVIGPRATVAVGVAGHAPAADRRQRSSSASAGRARDPSACRPRRPEPPGCRPGHVARCAVQLPAPGRQAARDPGRPGRAAGHHRRRRPGRDAALPADPTEQEVDPTGAGDTFLAALLAVLVRSSVAGSPAARSHGRCVSRRPPARSPSRTSAWTASRIGQRSSSGGRANACAGPSCRAFQHRSAWRTPASSARPGLDQ